MDEALVKFLLESIEPGPWTASTVGSRFEGSCRGSGPARTGNETESDWRRACDSARADARLIQYAPAIARAYLELCAEKREAKQ